MGNKSGKLIALFVWLLASLACNYPGLAPPPQELSGEQLRQTLAALVTATALGTPAPTLEAAQPAPTLFIGLSTATPYGAPPSGPTPGTDQAFQYYAQPGDTQQALAGRFGVAVEQIVSAQPIPAEAFIPPGQLLVIPNLLGETPYPSAILPDSEVINSPSAAGFDLGAFVRQAGGYLSTYSEPVGNERLSGVQIVERVAVDSSVNPRFLLALLEFQSGWVFGAPRDEAARKYPIGFVVGGQQGLYKELVMTATHLQLGYYGWRTGKVSELKFRDGSLARLSPGLNAGSVGVQNLFAKLYDQDGWRLALYGAEGFSALYQRTFGDPWSRAAAVEPLFPAGLEQAALELPFAPGERWSLTGGPHESWKTGSPRGAIDLAPVTGEKACAVSRVWVTASAPGLVTRSERNIVAIDLDGDGYEQTGWVVLYFHIADLERVLPGTRVQTDDPLGHPSCEGGRSTGTHVHIARKYNGEWIAADGPLPLVLSGWQAYADEKNYLGGLRKGEQVAVASPVGPRTSIVIR